MHACDGVVTGAIVYDHTSSLCGWHDKKEGEVVLCDLHTTRPTGCLLSWTNNHKK